MALTGELMTASLLNSHISFSNIIVQAAVPGTTTTTSSSSGGDGFSSSSSATMTTTSVIKTFLKAIFGSH